MDIIILADFCGPLDGTSNSRFLYLADMLAKDNSVEIITSDFNHGTKKYFQHEIEKHDYLVTMLHERSYPANVCLQRFVGHFIWGCSVRKYLKNRKKPDVIYCAIPPLTAPYLTAKYCEKNGVRFVIDVQDLWPEAFKMVFNISLLSKIVFAPFQFLADGIYKRADAICAVSKTYAERALRVNKKCTKAHVVYLGTELETFDRNAEQNPVIKPTEEIWVGYCGTLGASYDIGIVLDALASLKKCNVKQPKFIILGDGERRKEFESYAREKEINCLFTGRLPYDQMCGWLIACDMVVNPIMHNAAQSIINKHADYAASGLPVLNTQESQEYRDLVDEYQMGFNCKNGDPADLAEKLRTLIEEKELRQRMGRNARKCAEEKFDRRKTYQVIIDRIVEQ